MKWNPNNFKVDVKIGKNRESNQKIVEGLKRTQNHLPRLFIYGYDGYYLHILIVQCTFELRFLTGAFSCSFKG